jgi:hypothetical protein
MRSNDEAIANNTANWTPYADQDAAEEAWRQHSIGMDELTIRCCVDRMLALGAKANVMDLFADLIREHRLDRFVGRIGAE